MPCLTCSLYSYAKTCAQEWWRAARIHTQVVLTKLPLEHLSFLIEYRLIQAYLKNQEVLEDEVGKALSDGESEW